MLFRFSVYGFLKNQQYFEPFLMLALREKGLSFFAIGMLFGFREVCVALMDIPSGAVADLYGRRRSMILSFCAYIASFVMFALYQTVGALFLAMFLFAIGEVFRTGTHKAMIFEWLRAEGRLAEKTRVYGYTRSWSKIGSAVSALIAAGLVFWSGRYSAIFWFCIVPYALNIVNFLTYPKYLDGGRSERVSPARALRFTLDALRQALTVSALRRLFIESTLFEGAYTAVKDYMQPVLKSLALTSPLFLALPFMSDITNEARRGALAVGAAYAVLYLLMSAGSRHSHRLPDKLGGEENAARFVWWTYLASFGGMLIFLLSNQQALAVVFFIALGVIQNVFRPIQISRFDARSSPEMGATILSIESQSHSLLAVFLAPLAGLVVDWQKGVYPEGVRAFWPVAVVGILVCAAALAMRRTGQAEPKR